MSAYRRRVVTFPAPKQVEVIEEPLPDPEAGEVQVQTSMSAISPGTERLIYRGEAPATASDDQSIDSLTGDLSFPTAAGYATVGRVDALGPDVDRSWEGERVFSFQPHVSRYVAPTDDLIPLPDHVRDVDGILIPNLETAVTLLMDGRPVLGERVVIFGQGVVGLLTTALTSKYPVREILTVDPLHARRTRSEEWGAHRCFDPRTELETLRNRLEIQSEEAKPASKTGYEGADLVFEVSGTPHALDDVISVTGYDGRIIVGSWYGSKKAPIDFGGRFHRSRIQLESSQVSTIAPELRGRWSKKRRLQTVLDLLRLLQPGDLVSDVYPQQEASRAYEHLDASENLPLQPVFEYNFEYN